MASIVTSASVRSIGYQEERDCGDLVRFLLGGDLAQGDPFLAGPGGDDREGAEVGGAVVGPPVGLAVDGDEPIRLTPVGLDRLGDPVLKTSLKRLGLQNHDQATDAIARGDAVGKSVKPQPFSAVVLGSGGSFPVWR
jgi:hypothetical protein